MRGVMEKYTETECYFISLDNLHGPNILLIPLFSSVVVSIFNLLILSFHCVSLQLAFIAQFQVPSNMADFSLTISLNFILHVCLFICLYYVAAWTLLSVYLAMQFDLSQIIIIRSSRYNMHNFSLINLSKPILWLILSVSWSNIKNYDKGKLFLLFVEKNSSLHTNIEVFKNCVINVFNLFCECFLVGVSFGGNIGKQRHSNHMNQFEYQ